MSGRTALPAILLLGLLPPAASPADQAAPPDQPPPSQLDRIERKLDELLRRLPPGPPDTPPAAAPAASPGADGGAAPAAAPTGYRPGALLVARPAPDKVQDLAVPPPDSVGGFVYGGGTLRLDDLAERSVRYRGLAGIEPQGWLRAGEAGRYQLGLDGTADAAPGAAYVTTCRLAAWLEDRDLGFREAQARAVAGTEPARFTLVLGADLRPGLYKLRLWFACARVGPGQRLAVEPLAKAPSDLNLRGLGAADLLHREE